MSSHSSRASDGSRPADDTGRRQEVPAGVGPMVNTQRGEAKGSFLAETAHECFCDSPPSNCWLNELENEEYLPLQSAKLKKKT